jgi:hypothetical protein
LEARSPAGGIGDQKQTVASHRTNC